MNTSKKKFPFFKISADEFERQVSSHDQLPYKESSRGIAVSVFAFLLVFGIAVLLLLQELEVVAPIGIAEIIVALAVYAPLLWFTYKGHQWAMVCLGIWYTLDKVLSPIILTGSFDFSAIAFWALGMGPLWVAFQVEREFRKRKKAIPS